MLEDMPTRLPLKVYRIVPRKPYVDIDRRTAVLRLPGYFGRHRWTVPTSEIGVVDLASYDTESEVATDYVAGGLLLPYLFTTGPYTKPTTALVFRTPQRVPPVRLAAAMASNTSVGVGFFESRSKTGGTLDGVALRFADGAAAASALEAEGVERVTDVDAWFRAHRRIASPAEKQEALSTETRATWISRLQIVFIVLALGLFWIGGEDTPWWAFVPGMLLIVASIAMRPLAGRLMRTTREKQSRRRA